MVWDVSRWHSLLFLNFSVWTLATATVDLALLLRYFLLPTQWAGMVYS